MKNTDEVVAKALKTIHDKHGMIGWDLVDTISEVIDTVQYDTVERLMRNIAYHMSHPTIGGFDRIDLELLAVKHNVDLSKTDVT